MKLSVEKPELVITILRVLEPVNKASTFIPIDYGKEAQNNFVML